MKVLITGGAGYIGSHTNQYLNNMGIETVVVDDLSDGHREAGEEGVTNPLSVTQRAFHTSMHDEMHDL